MSQPVQSLQRLVLEEIAAGRPSNEILDRICELVKQVVPDGMVTVARFVPERGTLRYANAAGIDPDVLQNLDEAVPGPLSGTCGCAFFERRMVVVEDTATDPRWQELRERAKEFGIKACWSVPIRVDDDEVVGTFAISLSKHGAPSDDEREVLETAAYLAGIILRIERAEEATHEQAALLHAVAECAEDSIFAKGLDGRYLLANRAEARDCGLAPEQMIGRRDRDLFDEATAREIEACDRQVIEAGRSVMHELRLRSRRDGDSGEPREFVVRRDPLRNRDGKVVGVVGIARDVTDERRAERALQQTQKLESLGVLAGGVAHDFNNLMVGVLANASLLEDVHELTDDLRRVVTDIRVAAERAVELTGQLMRYAGKREPKRTAVDLPELLREIPTLLGKAFEQTAAIEFDCAEGVPPVAGDPVELRQVMMNLILNAGDAVLGVEREERRIQVRVERCGDVVPTGELLPGSPPDAPEWVLVEVVDNGVGMDRATLARIFDPFYSTKETGRGLGLAAVLGIIGAHRGCLSVSSTPGQGTCFRVWLPVATVRPAVAPKDVSAAGRARGHGRALVIDEEDSVREAAGRLLDRIGFETVLAADGASGIAAVRDQEAPFDVILLDVTMPGMAGGEVLRRLRELAPDVPVVLTSGLGELACRQAVGDQRIDAFLPKPFSLGDVVQCIERARRTAAAR